MSNKKKEIIRTIKFVLFSTSAGIIQIVRIFILPMQAHATDITVGGVTSKVMENGQFITVIIYLILSAAACFAAAYVGIKKSNELEAHMASLKKAAA